MHVTKTMSIRMDRDNYEFLSELTRQERSDLSKTVRDLVTRGRILLAIEKYRSGEASLGRAAELAPDAPVYAISDFLLFDHLDHLAPAPVLPTFLRSASPV